MLAGKIVQEKKELTQTTVKVSGVSNLNIMINELVLLQKFAEIITTATTITTAVRTFSPPLCRGFSRITSVPYVAAA